MLIIWLLQTKYRIFVPQMVLIAQQVRASDCGSEGRGFEPHWVPHLYIFY